MNICKIAGCNRKAHARGLCSPHYMDEWRTNRDSSYDRPTRKEKTIIDCGDYAEVVMYKLDGSEWFRTKMDKEDLHLVMGSTYLGLMGAGYVSIWHNKSTHGLHRVVLNAKKHVDHINRDKLDNRKCNLREVSGSQNNYNVSKKSDNNTGYKGVHTTTTKNKYRARIRVDKKEIHLGVFSSKMMAAVAYNRAAKKYHGEYACLNTFEQLGAGYE